MVPEKTDDNKITATLIKIHKLLNKEHFTVPELLLLYGNLGYEIGASIAMIEGPGPSLQELQLEDKINPTVDVALMLTGLLITTYEEDFLSHPKLSKWAVQNRINKGEKK
jgi:hypothetical protein